jgi:hypothetical protein
MLEPTLVVAIRSYPSIQLSLQRLSTKRLLFFMNGEFGARFAGVLQHAAGRASKVLLTASSLHLS